MLLLYTEYLYITQLNTKYVLQLTLEEQPGRTFTAHIQDMSIDKGPVTVFIEELGEK